MTKHNFAHYSFSSAAVESVQPFISQQGKVLESQEVITLQVRHDIQGDDEDRSTQSQGIVSKWRQKERLKTTAVALVLCLNIGVDPPDVIKISPCARLECWVDPLSMQPPKALDTIGICPLTPAVPTPFCIQSLCACTQRS